VRNLWVILLIAIPSFAIAESSFVIPREQCAWRAGDDPAWAVQNLDESGWKSLFGFGSAATRVWVRCHADLSPLRTSTDPSLQVWVEGAYELFLNGQLQGKSGNLATADRSVDTVRSYPVPAAFLNGGPVVIALRLAYRPYYGSIDTPEFRAGDSLSLRAMRALRALEGVDYVEVFAIPLCVVGVIGLLQLGLFFLDRTRRDILWLGIACVLPAFRGVALLLRCFMVNYSAQAEVAMFLVSSFSGIFAMLFFFALAQRPVPRYFWLLAVLSHFRQLTNIVAWFATPAIAWRITAINDPLLIHSILQWADAFFSLSPFVAFWPWARHRATMRPLIFCCFLWGAVDVLGSAPGAIGIAFFSDHFRQLFIVSAACSCAAILALLWLLFRDQRRITQERALLAGELQAARQIQAMLAPARIPTIPGLAIDVAFRPMRDVGGDFYLCRVLDNGRQRLLIGDVSGKGAAAAMTAALLIGGAEDHDDYAPARLLAHLDRVLRESQVGGFATCLCADFAPDGRVTLANAGHLPPYRRGLEIPVEQSLPLGLSGHNSGYSELELSVESGDTLTFFSDGVVEARNTTGELFGFDRAAALSTDSAAKIAKTAELFGQEDDITVLTLTFSGVPALQPQN